MKAIPLIVVGLLLFSAGNGWCIPDEFGPELHEQVFSAMLQALVYGIGLGLLVKMLNRS